ncbi:uncharacterized protein LOC129957423 [Argiope bruennichi]|uniref:IRF tryptophan pentad repeat domain-containing protein n=1 Tax=Argiope bruennichi TaxID=94029 RepID=A0A8T0FEY7_ARGBR|nr:uncharacterized protein LOC129957423 [Argiope bruennichi]KAF8788985.1 hypothetical protein HNY73_006967 [Argiope bruennichi]
MGRKGSRLLHFLQDGLIKKKYQNLFFVDESKFIFSINLPHKTRKLNKEDEQLFKDWYELKDDEYVFGSKDYTIAKQALIASLKKSDYFEKVASSRGKITYRILSNTETKERKGLMKELKKQNEVKKEVPHIDNSVPSVESGYGSGVDSPSSGNSMEPLNDNLIISRDNKLSQAFNSLEASYTVELKGTLSSVESSNGRGGDSPLKDNSTDPLNNGGNSCGNELSQSLEENILSDIMNLMDFCSENPELSSPTLKEDYLSENDSIKRWNFLQVTNISDEDLNDLFIKGIAALNPNVSTANKNNLHIHASKMQSIGELPMECQDILNEELNNKQVENISAVNPHLSMAYEENIPEQISSSQSEIKIMYEDASFKETEGLKADRETKFVIDHQMAFLDPTDDCSGFFQTPTVLTSILNTIV